MNARTQGELAVGLLGVWAMIQAAAMLANGIFLLVSMNREGNAAPLMWGINAPSVLMLVVGYIMVRHNAATVRFLFPRLDTTAAPDSLELSVVLVGCLGLFIFATSLPALLRTLLAYTADEQLRTPMLRASSLRSMAGYVVQAAFGAYVTLRPRQVLSLWK